MRSSPSHTVAKALALLIAALFSSGTAQTWAAVTSQGVIDGVANGGSMQVIVELELPVKPESGMSPGQVTSQRQAIAAVQQEVRGALSSAGSPPDKAFATIPAMAMQVNAASLQALQNSPRVKSIYEDRLSKISLNESNPVIEADQMWNGDPSITGAGYAVAVLDTGVDKNHTFFNDNDGAAVVAEYCASTTYEPYSIYSLCPNGAQTSNAPGSGLDCTGVYGCDHGTHVAGIVAGRPTSLTIGTVSGVAPKASIIAAQVFTRFDLDDFCGGTGTAPCVASYSSDQILALEYVLSLDVSQGGSLRVASVNMSLGGGQYFGFCDDVDPAFVNILNNLRDANIAVVIASGNNGFGDSINGPACFSTAISVASTTKSDRISNFSNIAGGDAIDLAAPGTQIASSLPNDTWARFDGTSMAAPHVAGAWALMREAHQLAGLSPSVNTILEALQQTATTVKLRENGYNTGFGVKRINIAQAAPEIEEELSVGLPVWMLYLATQNDIPPTNPGCDTQVDSDGDRLPDCYETNTGTYVSSTNTGTDPSNSDTDSDGISDGDEVLGTLDGLELGQMGANPLKKTILIEYDWLSDDTQSWRDISEGVDTTAAHNHRPSASVIADIEAVFAAAPVNNPDGSTGIQIIQDYGQGGAFTGGNEIADGDGNLAGYLGADFYDKKALNFASNRNGYFHYTILAHKYGGGATESSGYAEIEGDDLIVSSNWWLEYDFEVASTVVHELGHNLGLRHGGDENRNNKPNYNSVMNYNHQFPGVDTDCSGCGSDCSGGGDYLSGDGLINYSSGTNSSLNESALTESFGICSNVATDWNRNGSIDGGTVSYNINPDYDTSLNTLTDHDDWANIYYLGPSDADGAVISSVVETVQCDNVPPNPF